MIKYAHICFALFATFTLVSCGKPAHTHAHEHESGDSANAALDQLIMTRHDEVMPKSEDLYNLKKKLQDTLARSPKLPAAKIAEFEALITSLDSARASMETWMHTYDPKTDSADQEKNRAYMENEIEKINKIGERTTEVIDKAKAALK